MITKSLPKRAIRSLESMQRHAVEHKFMCQDEVQRRALRPADYAKSDKASASGGLREINLTTTYRVMRPRAGGSEITNRVPILHSQATMPASMVAPELA